MWHRHLTFFMILCLATTGLASCRKFETRRMLRKMMGSTVVLPEKVLCVQNGEVFPMPEELRSKPKLIVFVDSTECSTCRIDNFIRYGSLFDKSRETGLFSIMLLLTVKSAKYHDIEKHLVLSKFPYPIYLDIENCFRKDNPFIPDNTSMHALSVDSNNRVLLIGDPIYNESIMEMFQHIYNL